MTQFRLPAEWAPQSAVILTWPRPDGDWGDYHEDVERNFIDIARAITAYETVIISCQNTDPLAVKLSEAGIDQDRVRIEDIPSNDVWARDHGPITVTDDSQAMLLDFQFNGWGGKYQADLDNQITRKLYAAGRLGASPLRSINCILEGGAIDTDGEGVMMTTTDCLPLPSRNPGWTLRQFEEMFERELGIHTTHWLKHGHLAGDDTDGHVDTIARFCSPQCIVYQGCEDPDDEHYQTLSALGEELNTLQQSDGSSYDIQALPLPKPILDESGQRLPASYANFLIINGAVLMPGYNDPADSIAARILEECFPGREVITVDCRALIRQYGSLHCVTMQLPAQLKV